MSTKSAKTALSNAIVIGSLVLMTVAATPAPAQVCGPDPDGRLANAVYRDTTIVWEPIVEYERMVLTIAGPCEDIVRVFRRGEPIFFDIRDIERVQDGAYTWELRREAAIDASTKKELAKSRALDDPSIWWNLWQSGAIPQGPYVESAPFLVAHGVIVPPGQQEEEKSGPFAKAEPAARPVTSAAPAQLLSMPAASKRPRPSTAADQVIPDDLIVQGSACVGLDCVNNENFSFDTIRMKENNLRIHFDDTSTMAGYPANDWRLIANDSASGGASKFSIEDSTGAKTPFTVRAGAATNSIFVDSTGRVGFRTSTPVLDLHVNTSNTPSIRLEQNNSGGFTAQTWDIGANEANFFVRDVTGGSTLPLRIRPGAKTSAIDVSADSTVGLGEVSAADTLWVKAQETNDGLTIERGGSAQDTQLKFRNEINVTQWTMHFDGSLPEDLYLFPAATSQDLLLQINEAGTNFGNVGIGTESPTSKLHVVGDLTVTGAKNFAVADPDDSTRSIYYAALEGPEAGTYFRGTATTVGGKIEIQLPRYFAKLTEVEGMTVQLTPVGGWSQLYVEEKTPERLIIRVAEGNQDVQFDYLVHGVRKGYRDFQVERPINLSPQR